MSASDQETPRYTGFGGAIAAMRVPAFRDYTLSNSASLTGTWLQKLATGWLVWQLTESPSWLGILAFVDLMTIITVSPLMGAVADRMNRQRLMVVAQCIMMSQAVLFAVLFAGGWLNIWIVLVLQVLQSAGQGTHTASRLAMLPNLVPKYLLAPAIGVNAVTFNMARFVGPAIAGVVISQWGQLPAFIINALSYIPVTIVLWNMRLPTPEQIYKPQGSMLTQIGDGIRYAANHPGIGPLILIMGLTAFAVRALPDLLPGFSADVFGRGVDGLAWLTSAMGIGAAGAGLMLTRVNGTQGLTRRLTWNVCAMSLSVLAFVATREFAIGVIAAAVCGYTMTANGTTAQTLIQSSVDGAVRGRVMSSYTLIYQGMPALGGLTFGHLAEAVGLQWSFAVGAGLCFAAFLWMMTRQAAMAPLLEGAPAAERPPP